MARPSKGRTAKPYTLRMTPALRAALEELPGDLSDNINGILALAVLNDEDCLPGLDLPSDVREELDRASRVHRRPSRWMVVRVLTDWMESQQLRRERIAAAQERNLMLMAGK